MRALPHRGLAAPRHGRVDARFLVLGLLLFLAATMTVLVFQAEPADKHPGSVASSAEEGRRALALLLAALGFETATWRQPPGTLPPGDRLVWLAALPAPLEKGDQRDTPRSLTHYRDFVRAGGRLAVPAGGDDIERLVTECGFRELAGLTVVSDTASDARPARWRTGEFLEVQQGAHFEGLPDLASTLLAGSGGEPYVIEVSVGKGALLLFADDAWLANERIGAHDHGLLAARFAEHAAPERALWFDEYALGRWRPSSALSLALGPGARPFTLHLLLLALLVVWRAAWVREFPRDPEPHEQAAPLSRARAQAALLVRGRRYDLLAAMLVRGSLARAAACLRVRLPAAPLDAAADKARSASDLAAPFTGAGRPVPAAWREACEREVTDDAGLERLARDLDRLESELPASKGGAGLAAPNGPGHASRRALPSAS